MTVSKIDKPGAYERQLLRKQGSVLFLPEERQVAEQQLAAARQRDEEELHRFSDEYRNLVQECIELKPSEESEVILELKARLDKAYIISAGLAGNQGEVQAALRKLIDLMMRAVRSGAAGDRQAEQELDQEELARQTNFELLHHPLVADLMNPKSPIDENALVPTLLTASERELEAALWLFGPEQLQAIAAKGKVLLARLDDEGVEAPHAGERLRQIEQALATTTDTISDNE